MISINRVRDIGIGTWMMYAAAKVFLFATSLGPFMGTLPDVIKVVVAVPTAFILGLGIAILFALGTGFVAGVVKEVE